MWPCVSWPFTSLPCLSTATNSLPTIMPSSLHVVLDRSNQLWPCWNCVTRRCVPPAPTESDHGKDSRAILTHPTTTVRHCQIPAATASRMPAGRHFCGSVVGRNSVAALQAERAFCAPYYRFVHTLDSTGNSPEMLGAAGPESEGFSAQPCTAPRRLDCGFRRTVSMCEDRTRILAMVHIGEGEQGVALVLQRDTHRADASCISKFAARKLLDDEVEQHLPGGQDWSGQRQNVMAQPLGERSDVARQPMRLGLGLPRKRQLDGKLVV